MCELNRRMACTSMSVWAAISCMPLHRVAHIYLCVHTKSSDSRFKGVVVFGVFLFISERISRNDKHESIAFFAHTTVKLDTRNKKAEWKNRKGAMNHML